MAIDSNLYKDQWIAEAYDYLYAESGIDRDLAFWESLAAECGGPALELACGTGRVALPLARAGHDITGLDLSPYQLAVARRKLARESAEVQARVRFLEGDMSDFALDERFGLIIIAFRSFQALLTREQQGACLRRCHEHLREGGRLAIDVFNPKLSLLAAGAMNLQAEHAGPGGTVIHETGRAEYDLANQSLVWTPRYECTGPDGPTEVHEYVTRLRYFFRFEIEWMLEACGFEMAALYGDFDRCPFTAESPEMVFVARRG